MIKYKCSIYDKSDGNIRNCRPIFGKDLLKVFEKNANEQFFREKLNGKFTFIDRDYRYIDSRPFDTEFVFLIDKSYDMGATWEEYAKTKFFKTDCEWDADRQQIKVTPQPYDDYSEILAGLDKEFNLIELAPEIVSMRYTKRPVIQIYRPGENSLGCFLNGIWWEQECETVTSHSDLVNTYYFGVMFVYKHITATVTKGTDFFGVNGEYDGIIKVNGYNADGILFKRNGNTRIRYRRQRGTGLEQNYCWHFYAISPLSNDELIFGCWNDGSIRSDLGENVFLTSTRITRDPLCPLSINEANTICTLNINTVIIYGRILQDYTGIPIPKNDITEANKNYRFVTPYNLITWNNNIIPISTSLRTSSQPTRWGKNEDINQYYLQPDDENAYFPIARKAWGLFAGVSFWYRFTERDAIVNNIYSKKQVLKDTHPLHSVISVLLKQVAPNLLYEDSTAYSQFFYELTNPVSGYYNGLKYLISQKSNILYGDYDRPANKAPIRLKEVFEMLKQVFKCYWFIENGKLRIEHISYFRNGGNYSSTPAIGEDLTTLICNKNGKAWSFLTNKWKYTKEEMSERYEFKWMDDSTEFFDGFPIEVLSPQVERGKIEQVQVSKFTTDIDFMLLNPSTISKDGFALFGAQWEDNRWETHFLNRVLENPNQTINLQNGALSWYFLHETYYTHDLPAKKIKINNIEQNAEGITRNKKQEVVFPSAHDPDLYKLIRTEIGDGQIEKISRNLNTQLNTVTLAYDTE